MISKKVAAAAIMSLVAALASQPAMAGVGGCGKFPGVGGCGSGQLTSNTPTSNVPVLLDNLRGAVRADYLEWVKAILDHGKKDGGLLQGGGTQTNEGVGGCKFGVGGCVCFNGIC
jgi:hypothetical protein